MSATGQAAGKARRYSTHIHSACIFIDTFRFQGDGKPVSQRKICELEGKSMYTDYTDVSFNAGEFHNNKLYFELSVTPIAPVGEEIKLCEVTFPKNGASKLKCTDNKRMSDIRPPLFQDYYY